MTAGLALNAEMILVLGLVMMTLVLFSLEWLRADLVALLMLVVIGIANLVPAEHLFAGFAGNAVIAILATMILGAGLDRTGVLGFAASFMLRVSGGDERRLIFVLCAVTGMVSAFMQNPAVAALFLPVASRISSRTGIPLFRLLMPMAGCIILGGTITMVGNSPQILLNDLIGSINKNLPSGADTLDPVHMFDVTPIGATLLLFGLGYFYWFWDRLAPKRDEDTRQMVTPRATESYFEQTYRIEGETCEFEVLAESPLVGMSIAEIESLASTPLILAIKTGDDARFAPYADQVVAAGTLLGVLGPRDDLMEWAEIQSLKEIPGQPNFAPMFNPSRAGIAEAVIPPNSRYIGQKVGELRLRKRYGIAVLAQNRGDKVWREDLRGRTIRQGDTLVFHGAWRDLANAADDRDFVVVTDYPKDEERTHRVPQAVFFFALAMVLALVSDLPLPVALLTGAIGMMLTGVLNMDEAYQAINWRTIFLMACLIPLGWAVDSSGAAGWIAQEVLAVLGDVPIWVLELALAILTTLFALVMSQVGATIVMVPMGVNFALAANGDPTEFALIATLAASNNFIAKSNPVYALIAGPAGYSRRELWRAGLPIMAAYIVIIIVMVNMVF